MDKTPNEKVPVPPSKKIIIIIVSFMLIVACILAYFIHDIKTYKGNYKNRDKSTAYSAQESKKNEPNTFSADDYSDSRVANPRKVEKGEGLEKHNIDKNNKDFKQVPNCNLKSEGTIVEMSEAFLKDPERAKKIYKGQTVRIESSSYKISGNRNFILLTPNTGDPEIDKVQFTCYVSSSERDIVDRMEKAEPVYVEGRVGYVGKVTGFDIDANNFGYVH